MIYIYKYIFVYLLTNKQIDIIILFLPQQTPRSLFIQKNKIQ
jgi:hypothetical protein